MPSCLFYKEEQDGHNEARDMRGRFHCNVLRGRSEGIAANLRALD